MILLTRFYIYCTKAWDETIQGQQWSYNIPVYAQPSYVACGHVPADALTLSPVPRTPVSPRSLWLTAFQCTVSWYLMELLPVSRTPVSPRRHWLTAFHYTVYWPLIQLFFCFTEETTQLVLSFVFYLHLIPSYLPTTTPQQEVVIGLRPQLYNG